MSGFRSLPVDDIVARGTIKDSDIAACRRVLYEDGVISCDEAELVLKLNERCPNKAAAWDEFFIEAITDYIVFQERPQGYVTATNAHWLIDRIAHDGKLIKRADLDLIVNVLDKARWAPVSLVKFALEHVKSTVISGMGPLREGKAFAPGTITAGEVDLLRRILYAFAGDGNVAITRDEAEVLFEIDVAVAGTTPNPAWTDLFVKAVANVVMAASGYRVPTREEALRQEASLEHPERQTSMRAFLASMRYIGSIKDTYLDQTHEERALARLEHQRIEIITSEEITEAEANWLVSRIGRSGRLSPSEMALVAYLKHESPKIHPVLTEAVERLVEAA